MFVRFLFSFAVTGLVVNTQSCRDRVKQPFDSTSIWNMPIGSSSEFYPANIFSSSYPQPNNFFGDVDYFYQILSSDPYVKWYNQGHWGSPCDTNSYCTITGDLMPSPIQFPDNVTITDFCNNNAAALLQPDNITLLQMQPLYVCSKGGSVLALDWAVKDENVSILSDGIFGAHGGSHLSSIGGTIRLDELIGNNITSISHSLKLELDAITYYYNNPCYVWPASTCDGYHNSRYNGSNKYLMPGSLLAVPEEYYKDLNSQLKTIPGSKILYALTYYGGYLCDDTYANRGTICIENGVNSQFSNYWGYSFNAQKGEIFYNDLLLIFKNLQIVINNNENNIGGGGNPLKPLAPPICQ